MTLDSLRLRHLASTWFPLIVGLLLLVGTASAWVTYTSTVDPSTTTEERVVSSWETNGSFTHAATVQQSNPMFPVGQTLDDRNPYFLRVTPVLDGVFSFEYGASERGELDVNTTVFLETRRVVDDRDTETVLWSQREALATESSASLGPDARVRVPFSLNVSDVRHQSEQTEAAFGDLPGSTEMTIVAVVALNGEVNGQPRTTTERYTLAIEPTESVYYVTPNGSHETYQTMQAVPVETSSGGPWSVVGPLLLGMSGLGLALVARGRGSGYLSLSDDDRTYLEYRDDRSDYDDWIVRMRLPESAFDRPRVVADSLQDLVDFAIDTDNSVIEDSDGDAYFVLHNEHLYVYEPPRSGDADQDPDT
jgi:hypothetical protein